MFGLRSDTVTHTDAFDELFIGTSPELQSVLRATRMAAPTDVSILVQGESGTGKELLTQAIHRSSRRADMPLVTVNCAALPSELVESELFGHKRGSFTGANADHAGHIRAAEGGTLFLDEVGELPLAAQGKLLRFLDTGEVQPVGESTPYRADVRVLAATNRDLRTMVDAGTFRGDLYYRLNVVPMTLPPLRERTGDLDQLLEGFTRRFAEAHGLPAPVFGPDARDALHRYSWEGNVRELRNVCERMAILHPGAVLGMADLPPEIRDHGKTTITDEGFGFTLPEKGFNLSDLEQTVIRMALDKAQGNRSRAARLLGLTRDTLLYRIKKYAIQA